VLIPWAFFIENHDGTAEAIFKPGISWFEFDQIYPRSGMFLDNLNIFYKIWMH
jgi:hypothetical protein